MEDTLRVIRILWIKELLSVLILVLMEDTLRVTIPGSPNSYVVLILVLMEDTLRVRRRLNNDIESGS